jgi:hypothetical protein
MEWVSRGVQLAVQTERTVEAFVDYIKKNAAIPFTAPEIPKLKLDDPTDLGVEEGDEDIKDLSADDKVDQEEDIKDEL